MANSGNGTRKIILYVLLGIVIIGGGIYGWNWYSFAQSHVSTDNAQIDGHISPVISRVDGYVKNIYVTDNEIVEKGQKLVSIEKDQFDLGVQQAKSSLAAAKATYDDAQARLATAKSQKGQARVSLNQARSEKKRQQRLMNDSSTTQQRLDNAVYAYQGAKAKLNVVEKKIKAASTKVYQAKANIDKAKSSLDNAQLNLSYTELNAPIAGRVSKKNIEPGQYVRPGNPVMAIASDDSVWVVANFKEGQIAEIRDNQEVSIAVDAYPDTTFEGYVQSLAGATGSKFSLLPADNASGNFVKVEQRIPVKIMFNDISKLKKPLKPGMNVVPTIKISDE